MQKQVAEAVASALRSGAGVDAALAAGPLGTVLGVGQLVLGAGALAVKALYKTAKGIDELFDSLIDQMKQSTSPSIERAGRVFEGAKLGFAMGYLSSATVVAAGQWLMGNQMLATGQFVTAVTFTNPTVATCAAMGAVVYGYWALNDQERDDLLTRLSAGFQVGKELIRAIIQFVVDFTRRLLDSDFVKHIKAWIRAAAAAFGNGLGDVTRRSRDKVEDAWIRMRGMFRRGEGQAVVSLGSEDTAESSQNEPTKHQDQPGPAPITMQGPEGAAHAKNPQSRASRMADRCRQALKRTRWRRN